MAHGIRYSDNMKIIALGIRYQSTSAYKYLRNILCLPSLTTLEKLVSDSVKLEPGLSAPIMTILGNKVQKMSEIERNAVICFDEMSLKTFLSLRADYDEIEGFMNLGEFGERKQEYTNQALVVEVHGMFVKWKQPLGYLVPNSACPAKVLYDLAMRTIDELTNAGLNVRVLLCDLGTCNQSLFRKMMRISVDNPLFHHKGRKIYVMYDSPHLVKCLRNNLMSADYYQKCDDGSLKFVAAWSHFVTLANIDRAKPTFMRLCPKIGDKTHVHPNNFKRMKVKFATQVFSHTVSCALTTHAVDPDSPVPSTAVETANFFKFMDNLFDSFNSSRKFDSKIHKCAIKEGSIHEEFFKEARDYMSKLVKVDRKTGSITRPPSFDGWVQNCTAVLKLWDDVKSEGVDFLRLRLISQDSLENLFGVIRSLGGSRDNPTVAQFRDGLRQAMVSDVLNLRHVDGNCEPDNAKFLLDLKSTRNHSDSSASLNQSSENVRTSLSNMNAESMEIFSSPPSQTSFSEDNIEFYVAGVCVKKYANLSKNHQCDSECFSFLSRNDPELESSAVFTYLKAYSNCGGWSGALHVPTSDFLNCFKIWNRTFIQNIDDLVHERGLISKLTRLCLENSDLGWFPNNPKCREILEKLLIYFLRIRIYYMLKTLNQSIVDERKTKENRKYKKLNNI